MPANTRYTIDIVRGGQTRPYGPTQDEFIIYVEQNKAAWKVKDTPDEWHPWLYPEREDAASKKWFQDWCDSIAKALCQKYYRLTTEEGCDWASPMLKWMRVDREKGTIRFLTESAYTD